MDSKSCLEFGRPKNILLYHSTIPYIYFYDPNVLTSGRCETAPRKIFEICEIGKKSAESKTTRDSIAMKIFMFSKSNL